MQKLNLIVLFCAAAIVARVALTVPAIAPVAVDSMKIWSPDGFLSLEEAKAHQDIYRFVRWLRKRGYAENIVSRWVADFMDPNLTGMMTAELKMAGNPAWHLKSPMSITYIDLIPIDENMTPAPVDTLVVEELFTQTFAMETMIDYVAFPISYSDCFGPTKVQKLYGEDVAWLPGKAVNDYIDGPFTEEFYGGVQPLNRDIVRLAVSQIDGLKAATNAAGAGFLTMVGNETPNLEDGTSFWTHAHEWSHALKMNHHYSGGSEYGTFGTMSTVCDKYLGDYSAYFPALDPLEAYLLEPKGGFDDPELVLGQAYSDYLAGLQPCEAPFAADPDPQVLASVVLEPCLPQMCARVTLENSGDIPLAYLPLRVKAQYIPSHPLPRKVRTFTFLVHWLDAGETAEVLLPLGASPSVYKGWTAQVQVDSSAPAILEGVP